MRRGARGEGNHGLHDILAALGRKFAAHVAPQPVREHEVLREAASFGQAVVSFAPGSGAHQDFRALAEWIATAPAAQTAETAAPDGGSGAPAGYVDGPAGGPIQAADGSTFPRLAAVGRAAELAQRVRVSGSPAAGREAGS